MPRASRILRAVIVDDEAGAVAALEELLTRHAEIEVVATAGSVPQARRVLRELEPDVVFLDIEMPHMDGLALCADVGASIPVVLVTAHDDYAVDAFDTGARDYLLKPVTAERLARCIERLVGDTAAGPAVAVPENDLSPKGPRHVVAEGDGTVLVPEGEILWIEAHKSCSRVHATGGRTLLARGSLAAWEDVLPADRFVRVDRSLIVALERIERISWRSQGGTRLQLSGEDAALTLGRAATTRLKQVLGEQAAAPGPPRAR